MPSSLPFNIKELETGQNSLTKIGKLRLMKSGKVILRLHQKGNDGEHIDLDVSKGIQPAFY